MNEVAARTPMQYLDKAVGALRDMGVMPAKIEPVPINALLQQISDLEPEKIAVIARTLGQASVFNEVVRNEISGMEIGERYKAITEGFNSIRDDAKRMVDQMADSKLDVMERVTNVWMKIRGATSPTGSTRSRRPISTSPRPRRTRSSASIRSSRPTAISAARSSRPSFGARGAQDRNGEA